MHRDQIPPLSKIDQPSHSHHDDPTLGVKWSTTQGKSGGKSVIARVPEGH
jgi:hypothetical protein